MLLKKSFVIHLCCLKKIVLGKLSISRKRYKPPPFVNFGSISSIVGSWYRSRYSALFSGLGSMQTRISPDFFVAITIRLFQPVDLSTRVITPRFCSLFNSSLTREIIDIGIRPSGAVWGVMVGSTSRYNWPGSLLKTFEYSVISCSLTESDWTLAMLS